MSRMIDKIRLRLASLFRAGTVEQSLKREIELHLQEQIDENLAAGMSPADARAVCYSASRTTRPIAVDSRSQLSSSRVSCRRPAAVRA